VELYANSRLADGTNDKFKFWFNATSKTKGGWAVPSHMKKIETSVASLVKGSKGRMSVEWIDPSKGYFQLDL